MHRDTKALFGSLEGREWEGKALCGEKYMGKLKNISHFLKKYFF